MHKRRAMLAATSALSLFLATILTHPTSRAQTTIPAEACLGIPAALDARLDPSNCVRAGDRLTVYVTTFESGLLVTTRILGGDGLMGGADHALRVGPGGRLLTPVNTANYYGAPLPAGDYVFYAKDITGRYRPAAAPFRVIAPPPLPTPTPEPTSVPEPEPTALPGEPNTPPDDPPTGVGSELCENNPEPETALNFPIQIVGIDKGLEIVTLANLSDEAIDLDAWTMCSITGNQAHEPLGGVLEPGATVEFQSEASGPIWNDEDADDGALYNPDGELISYWDEGGDGAEPEE